MDNIPNKVKHEVVRVSVQVLIKDVGSQRGEMCMTERNSKTVDGTRMNVY